MCALNNPHVPENSEVLMSMAGNVMSGKMALIKERFRRTLFTLLGLQQNSPVMRDGGMRGSFLGNKDHIIAS